MTCRTSNSDFLRAIFGAEWEQAHVTAFACAPAGANGRWRGGRARTQLSRFSPGDNTYFAVSTFKHDRRSRECFVALHVIVFDDVGTSAKVDPAKISARRLRPSWRLETSPGNEQWGFILAEPETNRARAEGAIRGLIAAGLTEDGRDPGQSGVTRYVRLPVGRNRKLAHGPDGFQTILREWDPRRRYALDDIAAAWGIDLAVAADAARAAVVQMQRPRDGADDVLALLRDLGLVQAYQSDGRVHIICPFVDEHTGGDASGTAYLTGGGFKCHHGHCAERRTPDFLERLNELAREADIPGLAARDFSRSAREARNAFELRFYTTGIVSDDDAYWCADNLTDDEVRGIAEDVADMFWPVDLAELLRRVRAAREELASGRQLSILRLPGTPLGPAQDAPAIVQAATAEAAARDLSARLRERASGAVGQPPVTLWRPRWRVQTGGV